MIDNNVRGFISVLTAAESVRSVSRFVLVSTDKAVRPPNIMGLSKMICEIYAKVFVKEKHTSYDADSGVPMMRVAIVRFGNVLNSSGSVLPKFISQVKSGGPVTVTDPLASRYFMAIEEAALLIIHAMLLEPSVEREGSVPVFLLDMGEPVLISELAKKVIESMGYGYQIQSSRLSDSIPEALGSSVAPIIDIVFTGLTDGEKMFEELYYGKVTLPTPNPKIYMDSSDMVGQGVSTNSVVELLDAMREMSRDEIFKAANGLVEEVDH